MTMNKVAIDTNVLVYLFDEYFIGKKEIAGNLVDLNPFVSTQVVSEFLNVSKRLLKIPKLDLLQLCNQTLTKCVITPTTQLVLNHAELLIKKYDFQLFDGIIVAAALQANCTTLYSEDMQHGLVIAEQLTIANPFL
jgi:predicted nucleic acid-binding protein